MSQTKLPTPEERLDRIESYLRMRGESACEACGSWLHTAPTLRGATLIGAYTFLGKRLCAGCVRSMLIAMRDNDGPEWTPFLDLKTRKSAMLDLAEIGLRSPAIAKLANEALAAVGEDWVAGSWTAARLAVSAAF